MADDAEVVGLAALPSTRSTFWVPENSTPATSALATPLVLSTASLALVAKTLVKSPPLSTAADSTASARFAASVFAAEFQPFLRWLRNVGIAIAARMPMMIMTTRSSMRVKPSSFFSMALLMRASMVELPFRDDRRRCSSSAEAAGPTPR